MNCLTVTVYSRSTGARRVKAEVFLQQLCCGPAASGWPHVVASVRPFSTVQELFVAIEPAKLDQGHVTEAWIDAFLRRQGQLCALPISLVASRLAA